MDYYENHKIEMFKELVNLSNDDFYFIYNIFVLITKLKINVRDEKFKAWKSFLKKESEKKEKNQKLCTKTMAYSIENAFWFTYN